MATTQKTVFTTTGLEPKCYSCSGESCEKHDHCRQWQDLEAAKLREDLRQFKESI